VRGSFIARGRFPNDRLPRGNSTIPPGLAVEVISLYDLAEDIEQRIADFLIEQRIADFLSAGTRVVGPAAAAAAGGRA
jgi:hypothetical protein